MKVPGSTLIESLIALVIIVTIITISMNTLVSNAQFSSRNLLLQSIIISDDLIQKSKDENKFESETVSYGGLKIEKSVSFVNRYDGVIKIKITSLLGEKTIYEKEELVYIK